MQKIPTLFFRDEQSRKVIPGWHPDCLWVPRGEGIATEKLDGTNVRLTTRRGVIVRVEKRRNPTRVQKLLGIVDPWYVDANTNVPSDQHIMNAVFATDTFNWEDGEHVCEAIGPSINGNPLRLTYPTCVRLFGERRGVPIVKDPVARTFEGIRELLAELKSTYDRAAVDAFAEGVVFCHPDGRLAKIKRNDFGS